MLTIIVEDGYQEWLAADPRRADSHYVPLGSYWKYPWGRNWPRWRVNWLKSTGEIYATNPPFGQIIVLGHCLTSDELEHKLRGWQKAEHIAGLEWIALRLQGKRIDVSEQN